MHKSNIFNRSKVSLAISLALSSASLYAEEVRLSYNQQGVPVFETHFFDVGDGPYMHGDSDDAPPTTSTWNLSKEQEDKVQHAIDYWASVIRPPPGLAPAVINVGTYPGDNAAGTSDPIQESPTAGVTQLQSYFAGEPQDGLTYGSVGQFMLGKGLHFDTEPYVPSQQINTADFNLAATALHELAHGLGISNWTGDNGTPEDDDNNIPGVYKPYFQSVISNWAEHLRTTTAMPPGPTRPYSAPAAPTPMTPRPSTCARTRATSPAAM
jgi:hypothetical protein